jgi:hypothetical protein
MSPPQLGHTLSLLLPSPLHLIPYACQLCADGCFRAAAWAHLAVTAQHLMSCL